MVTNTSNLNMDYDWLPPHLAVLTTSILHYISAIMRRHNVLPASGVKNGALPFIECVFYYG